MRRYLLVIFLLSAFVYIIDPFSKQPAEASPTTSSARAVSITRDDVTKGKLTPVNFEDSIMVLYDRIGLEQRGLAYPVFRMGIIGYHTLRHEGALNNKSLLTIIDFSQPSTSKRFYTIDLNNLKVKYHSLVAHGRNTGENMATKFSNKPHSNQSSLGFYVTGETYVGSKGFSLKLDGKEKTFNDKIRDRAVVIHDAEYVSEYWIKRYGRLGRSQGSPPLQKEISKQDINTIKNRTAVFAYYPDQSYLHASRYLDVNNLMGILADQGGQRNSEKHI